MKKTGKIGSILCLLALLRLTGIYALPKVYVLYQANTGKVDICLKEYMLEEGKEVPWKNGKDVLPGGFVSKIPRIRNDGAECYVRATVSFSSQKESENHCHWKIWKESAVTGYGMVITSIISIR